MGEQKAAGPLKYGRVKRNAMPERIASNLISLIRENQLGPGDRLPPERELATLMGVSRSTLREALRALSILNIIEMRQGDGTYVSSLDIELLVEPLDHVLTMDSPTLTQLFEARRILELGAIGLAAERISPEEIATLDGCLQRALESQERLDYANFLLADINLHETIAQAARNPLLLRFVISMRVLGKASRERTVRLPGVVDQTIKDHKAIVDALKKKDAPKAQSSMLEHLNNIELQLKEAILMQRSESDAPSSEGSD